jgi:hypothetical protein
MIIHIQFGFNQVTEPKLYIDDHLVTLTKLKYYLNSKLITSTEKVAGPLGKM